MPQIWCANIKPFCQFAKYAGLHHHEWFTFPPCATEVIFLLGLSTVTVAWASYLETNSIPVEHRVAWRWRDETPKALAFSKDKDQKGSMNPTGFWRRGSSTRDLWFLLPLEEAFCCSAQWWCNRKQFHVVCNVKISVKNKRVWISGKSEEVNVSPGGNFLQKCGIKQVNKGQIATVKKYEATILSVSPWSEKR